MIKRNGVTIEKLEIDVGDTGHITNCYFVIDSQNNLCIIDPADKAQDIVSVIEKKRLNLSAVFLTHCHSDHTCAVQSLIEKYSDVKVYVHQSDIDGLNAPDINCENVVGVNVPEIDTRCVKALQDGDLINVGKLSFLVVHTPGHTAGSIVFWEKTSNVLFTGDTVFSNTYGRTDLKTGSHFDMRQSLDKLFDKFDDILCFSGHGDSFVLADVKRKINLLFAYKG